MLITGGVFQQSSRSILTCKAMNRLKSSMDENAPKPNFFNLKKKAQNYRQ